MSKDGPYTGPISPNVRRTPFSFVTLLAIVALIAVAVTAPRTDGNYIASWAATRHEFVEEKDARSFDSGPFVYIRGVRIYRVQTNKATYWFRFGLSISVYEENDGVYTELE